MGHHHLEDEIDDVTDSVEGVDDDAEEVEEVEEVEEEADPPDDHLNRIYEDLGAGEESTLDLSTLDARTLAAMPPAARGIIRAMKQQRDRDVAAARETAEATLDQARAESAAAKAAQKEVVRSRARLAQLFGSEELQAQIKAGKAIDTKNLDMTDENDVRKFHEAQHAASMETLAKPIADYAAQARREASRDGIIEKYPDDFAKPGFEDEVKAVIVAWKKAGEDPGGRLEEAINKVQLNRFYAAQAQAKARRQDLAKKSQRAARSRAGSAGTSRAEGPPAHVQADPVKMANWVTQNPKQASAYAAKFRR